MSIARATTSAAASADAWVARFRKAEETLFRNHNLTVLESYLDLDAPRLRVRILETGEGPPVILLPGLGAVAATWAPLLARLQGMRLIALDRPGCGLSDSLDLTGTDLRRFSVGIVASVARALRLERVSIIGNSIGGTTGLWFATEHANRVDRLVLLGVPPFVMDAQAPLSMRLMSISFVARRALSRSTPAAADELFVRMGHPHGMVRGDLLELFLASRHLPGYTDGFIRLIQGATGLGGRRVAAPARELATLDCPTLLIWGRNDTHGPFSRGERLTRTLPHARLELVGSGHLPWLDEPDECARLTQDFLRPN